MALLSLLGLASIAVGAGAEFAVFEESGSTKIRPFGRISRSECLASLRDGGLVILLECWKEERRQLILPEAGMAGAVQLEGTTSCLTMRVPSGYAVFEQCDATSLEQKFIRPNAKKGPIISFLEPGMCLQHTRLIRNFIEEANPGGERLHRSLAFSNHSQGRQLIDKLFSIDYHGCTQWTFTRRNPETNPWVQSGIRNALRLSVGCVSCILTAVLAVIAARSICAGFMRHSTGATTSPGSSPAKHRPSLPSFTRRMFQARAAKILFWRGYPRSDGDGRNRVRELVAKQRVQHALKASQAAMAPVLLLLAVEIHSCFVTYRNRHDILGTSFFLSVPFAAVFCLVCKLRSTKVTTGQLDIVHCCAAVMWALQYSMIISLGEAIEDNADVHQIGMVRLLFSLILGNASLTAFLQTTVSLFYIACTMYQYDLPLRKLWVSGDWTSHYIVILSVILVRVLESERLAVATATVNARESRLAERLVKSLLHSVCDCCVACNSNFDITEGSDRLCALVFRSGPARRGNFLEFLSEEDVERFQNFISCTVLPLAEQDEQDKPTIPFFAHLSSCHGNRVPCHIFCSAVRNLNEDIVFVFGINDSGEAGLPPAMLSTASSHVTPEGEESPLAATLVGARSSDAESSFSSSICSVSSKHLWLGYTNDFDILQNNNFLARWTGKRGKSKEDGPVCLNHLFYREEEFLAFKHWHLQVIRDIESGAQPEDWSFQPPGSFLWYRKQKRSACSFYTVHLEVDFSHFDEGIFRLAVSAINKVSKPSYGTPSEVSLRDLGMKSDVPRTLRAMDSSSTALATRTAL